MKFLKDLTMKMDNDNEKSIMITFENLYYYDSDFKSVFNFMYKEAEKTTNLKEWFVKIEQEIRGRKYNKEFEMIVGLLKNTTVLPKLFKEFQISIEEERKQVEIEQKRQETLISVEELSNKLNEIGVIDFQFAIGQYKDGYCPIVNINRTNGGSAGAEVYGEKAILYVRFDKELNLEELIEKCQNAGLIFDTERAKELKKNGINEIDFEVKYFKGWHWDE